MTNFQVYRKTLSFSFIGFLVSLVALAILVGCAVAGYYIGNNSSSDNALIGLVIGLVVGIAIAILINYFIFNRIKAGQVAMMAKGVADGQLPDRVYHAGMEEVKGRFAKITLFFMVTGLIKSMFHQIGRGINKVGTMIGGDAGNAVTSAIDSGIQILLGYLIDCCLGWVMYRKDQGVARSACEGAVIFFKNGKTLIRNIGRIFGMGFLSLLVVGGALFGGFYLVLMQLPTVMANLSQAIIDFAAKVQWTDMPEFIHDVKILTIVVAAIAALLLWSTLHSVIMRPFILVGVLRNFMAAGKKELPTEKDFAELKSKSPKFAKMLAKDI